MYYLHCWCFSTGFELYEGKLRILQHNGADTASMGLNWGSKLPSKQLVHLWLCLLFASSPVSVWVSWLRRFYEPASRYLCWAYQIFRAMHFFTKVQRAIFSIFTSALIKCRLYYCLFLWCHLPKLPGMLFCHLYLFWLAWYNFGIPFFCKKTLVYLAGSEARTGRLNDHLRS